MELPPRQGEEAKEPVSHTQPISSCNYPFSSVHHSSVRIPQPLNTQSTNDPLCTGSSERACDTCCKSENPEEVFYIVVAITVLYSSNSIIVHTLIRN